MRQLCNGVHHLALGAGTLLLANISSPLDDGRGPSQRIIQMSGDLVSHRLEQPKPEDKDYHTQGERVPGVEPQP